MSIIPTIEEIIEKMVEANKELNNHKIAVATFALKRRREEDLKTLEALKSELKQKDEKLSSHENGIPIENADKKKRYQHINSYGNMATVMWRDNCWCIKVGAIDDRRAEWLKFTGTHVYPLPSTETATKEGE